MTTFSVAPSSGVPYADAPFKLSPNVYLDRFNTYRKVDSESYVAFASRLKGLLNFYLESRHVDDFDGLFELLILRPIREFTDSFVDDIAVHSDEWKEHLKDIDHCDDLENGDQP